ncbi:MAG: NAD-dependent epimerase [Spirochaetia bacterium]
MLHLITGAAGFIGFHLARRLLDRGGEVVGLDCLNDYYDPALKMARLAELGIGAAAEEWGVETRSSRYEKLSFFRLALEDRAGMERLFAARRFDRVCNLAAQAGVRYSLVNPRAYVESNVAGFLNVLECCRETGISHLVYASSSSVYGLDAVQPSSTHDRADHPMSMYAATKRANELMAHTYSHLYGLPTTGLRFFTVYGPWGRPDMAYFKFARSILAGLPIDVYNNGDMLRDFTYVDDVVEGLVRVLDRIPMADQSWEPRRADPAGSRAPYKLYNLGNNAPEKLSDFISALESALGRKAVRRYLPMQQGDVQASCADVADLERDLGWKPRTKIGEGLDRFVKWYLAHQERTGQGRMT